MCYHCVPSTNGMNLQVRKIKKNRLLLLQDLGTIVSRSVDAYQPATLSKKIHQLKNDSGNQNSKRTEMRQQMTPSLLWLLLAKCTR